MIQRNCNTRRTQQQTINITQQQTSNKGQTIHDIDQLQTPSNTNQQTNTKINCPTTNNKQHQQQTPNKQHTTAPTQQQTMASTNNKQHQGQSDNTHQTANHNEA